MNNNQITIKSDLSKVKVLSGHFRSFCESNRIDEHTSGLLELVIVEAVNNIIIHAYKSDSGLDIKAEYELLSSEMIIKLTDFGFEFSKKKTENKPVNLDVKDLAEGNWGLDLIDTIADEVIRDRKNNSNILIIKKKIQI